mgnify:CR=1 FL=1
MKKIILGIVAVVVLGGGVYFFFSKSQPQQSPEQLVGLWQRIDEPGTWFLEFKQNEFCANWSGGTPEKFICGQYLPYQLDGNKMLVNGSPWADWKIVNGKLEFKPKSQLDKDVYEKIR